MVLYQKVTSLCRHIYHRVANGKLQCVSLSKVTSLGVVAIFLTQLNLLGFILVIHVLTFYHILKPSTVELMRRLFEDNF